MPQLEQMSKDDLYELAQKRDVDGRSAMSKAELVAALEDGGREHSPEGPSETSSRPIWRGAVNFGLITILVGLYTAVEDRDVSFHLLSADDGSRVRYRRVNEATGKEVDWDDIVRGYEYEKGKYVTFTDEELESLQPESSRTIDISVFVESESVDPLYFERSYYAAPEETSAKAYRLLVSALEEAGRVGIASVTIRQKERLCLLRPRDETLVLETMHWPDEIRVPAFETLKANASVKKSELEMAKTLIGHLAAEFDPTEFHDTFRARIEAAVDEKVAGNEVTIEPAAEPEPTKVADLMAVLKASVESTKTRKSA